MNQAKTARLIIGNPGGILFGVKNAITREWVHVMASDGEEAKKATGWGCNVLYILQLETRKPPIPEKVKAELRERAAFKKSICGKRCGRNDDEISIDIPKAAGKGAKKEEEAMGIGTLEALKEARTNAAESKKPRVRAKVKIVKPKKTNRTMKPEREKSDGDLFGLSLSSVLRWMGKDGLSATEATGVLKALKIKKMPADASIHKQVSGGRLSKHGEPAKLTVEQQKQIRDAAKKIEVEVEKKPEEKKESKAA